jgi:Mn-dependent DtxR family transcriptional regulator
MSSESQGPGTDVVATAPSAVGGTLGRYLLAIHWLADADSTRVSTGELQRSLDVSAPTVSETVAKLGDRGLVDYEKYRGVMLTPRGDAVATRLARQFCIVTTFFESVLDVSLDDEMAYDIGVTLPEDALFRLRELTDRPCIDDCPETAGEDSGCFA